MEMTWDLAIFIFIAQFLGFIIKGLTGFGNPLLANPLMAMRIDNVQITPGVLPVDLCVNLFISFKNRKSFILKLALPVAACIMVGVVPGTLFLKVGTQWVIKALLGAFIIFLGIEMLTRKNTEETNKKNNLFSLGIVSVISGFLSGLFGINMLMVAYLNRYVANRHQFRANVCFIFCFENIFRLIMYAINGMLTTFTLYISLLSVPAAILGVALGNRIDLKLDERKSKIAMCSVFIFGGVSILVKALIFKV